MGTPRDRKLDGHKFRRQHPLANFIADFYFSKSKLVVEVDGNYHNKQDQQQYDQGRTYELFEPGIRVVCITNSKLADKLP